MRIIFIRHAEPDYVHDSLTEKGQREAQLLALRVAAWKGIDDIYVSPLRRAQLTAEPSLKAMAREAVCFHWLREVASRVTMPDGREHIAWDFCPAYWTGEPVMFDKDKWFEAPILRRRSKVSL